MPVKCHVIDCTKPAVSKGLCDTHRKRLERHGHVDQTRPVDWGSREKHPAYRAWSGLIRYHKRSTCSEWINDFWAFANSIPEKPSSESRACRPDPNAPWGPDNFYWREPRIADETKSARAAFMRDLRNANPEYFKNTYLKKNYGVTLDWYKEQSAKQGDACAICKQPETSVIRGKVISLAVDHCHDTGKVRGLLCAACNTAIGSMKHDPDLLRKAIAYLDTYV